MRSRTTWLAILLAISAGTGLTIAACTPDATAPRATEDPARLATDKKLDELRQRYGWVGDYHTDGLAYVYLQLVNNTKGKKQKSTQKELCKIAAKALKEFHRQARKGEVPFGIVDPSIDAETCPSGDGEKSVSKNVLVSNPRVQADEMSPLANSYLNQVTDAINSATTRTALLGSLLAIQYAAVANLPELEAGAVVATVSVAISSMDYWEANLDAWVNLPADLATPYSRASTSTGISLVPQAPYAVRTPKWWTHPYIKGYLKVVGADAAAGARAFYMTWRLGPVGWDAAAAAALWSSVSMTLSLLF